MKPVMPDVLAACPAGSLQASISRALGNRSPRSVAFDLGHDRVIRRREVQYNTGLSRSSLYRLIASGNFPPPIQLSENAVGWLATEVSAWIAGRVAATRSNGTSPALAPDGQ